MNDVIRKRIEALYKIPKSSTLIFSSMHLLFECSIIEIVIFMVISILLSIVIGISADTVSIYKSAIGLYNNIVLVQLGIVFTGYVFFQALVNDKLLVKMIKLPEASSSSESYLKYSHEYFVRLMFADVMLIMVNCILLIVFFGVSDDFHLPMSVICNNTLAVCLLTLYNYLMLKVIWEIKSFIYNIYQIFNMHAGTRITEAIKEGNDDER